MFTCNLFCYVCDFSVCFVFNVCVFTRDLPINKDTGGEDEHVTSGQGISLCCRGETECGGGHLLGRRVSREAEVESRPTGYKQVSVSSYRSGGAGDILSVRGVGPQTDRAQAETPD